MKKITAMHALLAVLCFSITIFCIAINNSKGTTAFSIITAANIAGIGTIAFFTKEVMFKPNILFIVSVNY